MKPLSIKCPNCGSHASLVAEKEKSQNVSLAAFRCDNTDCQRRFYGEMILTREKHPGMECFSSGAHDSAPILTDC
jgi:endogenous inhibitor of DNA gyrase (YacG/DUF329 family)